MDNPGDLDGLDESTRRSIELLWNPDRPGRRGPRAQLTAVAIARTAIAIADADGLAAVSMQRVATELGYTTMSLYNHVKSKDLLLELMIDLVSEPDPAVRYDQGDDWRRNVLRWAGDVWRLFTEQHPWALDVRFDRPPVGPQQLSRLEQVLAALSGSRLPDEEAMSTALFVLTSVRGAAQLLASPGTDSGWFTGLAARVLDPKRFPHAARILKATEVATPTSSEFGLPPELDLGLRWTLDAIEARYG